MAEENYLEPDMEHTHDDVDNVEETYHEENVENVEDLEEHVEDFENAETFEHVENLENLENIENLEDEKSNPGEEIEETENNMEIKEEKKWPGWPGENVFRLLVPAQKVGGIIGRKGEFIKKICEETKARIKILDGPPGTTERTVMVSAKEEPDLAQSPAMVALLTVHKRLIDADTESGNTTSITTRFLVAATQAGSLIGKQGSTIKTIQDTSTCVIRVLGGENLPIFALPDDSVVEVQGESGGVHKAVELIVTQLRKFLVDRSVIGIFESQMQMPNSRVVQNMGPPLPPPHHLQSWGPPHPHPPPPQGFGGGFGGGDGGYAPPPYMGPPPPQHRQYDNYYPPIEMEKQTPREGSSSSSSSLMVTKVTQNMQIPLSYADAVIGTSGSNISYIRRASGATIAIQETRGVPNEMTVEITGPASQVQTAQQLIQNFIADAAASNAQNQQGSGGVGGGGAPPPLTNQGYNSNPYPSSHGGGGVPGYGSSAPNAAGAGDYSSAAYGGPSYGY